MGEGDTCCRSVYSYVRQWKRGGIRYRLTDLHQRLVKLGESGARWLCILEPRSDWCSYRPVLVNSFEWHSDCIQRLLIVSYLHTEFKHWVPWQKCIPVWWSNRSLDNLQLSWRLHPSPSGGSTGWKTLPCWSVTHLKTFFCVFSNTFYSPDMQTISREYCHMDYISLNIEVFLFCRWSCVQ